MKVDDQTFLQNCSELRSEILHHYDQFSISTIDAFFQKVIRSFTREAELTGDYRLEVTASGFKRLVRDGIVLQVQQTARIDLQLAIGEVAESIIVTADVARLETETSTLAKVIDNRAFVNLPLNTRNVYNLVFLTPGVTGTVGNSYGEMRYSVNGARARTMDTGKPWFLFLTGGRGSGGVSFSVRRRRDDSGPTT